MRRSRVGINGMGRIGRLFLRACLEHPLYGDAFEIVAFNDVADAKTTAHLIKYDSVHGKLAQDVRVSESGAVKIGDKEFQYFMVSKPSDIPWDSADVDVVVESTGLFTERKNAAGHLSHGVERVIISAPSKDADVTIVPGVNETMYDPSKHTVISGASCTTNCLAPMVKILLDNFGLVKGYMTTVHAYTNDQRLLDLYHKDLRRARAASLSVIPTTTGAATALHQVIPQVKGKLHGIALRVPVPNGSLTDLSAVLETPASVEQVNEAFREEAAGRMKGIVEYNEDPIVSADIIGNPHSCIFDATQTLVLGDKNEFVKVFGWYDNEWGYSNRLVDLVLLVSGHARKK
ncbi:MAG: type I glyceraldehyde-3-phosphate dehydrogenase [Candidatus Caldarchaeum sp.]|nr:type I glyceraldehyde-3-phosphate dehydrogenase [Candidatus Caldarchaeum sp.]